MRTRPSHDYAKGNKEAATIILTRPGFYGGPGSLAVKWAELWIAKHGDAQPQQQHQAQPDGAVEQLALSFEAREALSVSK
jgi:hypothetical protein